ncbi:adenosylcobinamide-GDP ribazoletransferase [Halocatena halophila]|uniref:adenosylcobinamide-GDP ribazoletransferase n=1 Tax=Halocatena halophila TaxID=2814576 RepID=UPI002ED6425E
MNFHAVRGAIGFCSRLPVGADERAFEAFTETPGAFVLAAVPIGGIAGALIATIVSVLGTNHPGTVGLGVVCVLYAVAGINHLDGVADLGDVAVVHGDLSRRRAVLTDTTLGVGGTLFVCLVVIGVTIAGFELASLPSLAVFTIVLAGELGAKGGMATIACLGTPFRDGLGATVLAGLATADLRKPIALAAVITAGLCLLAPVALLTVCSGWAGALLVWRWARRTLDGTNGDVFGCANEIGRLCALHVGVITWTLW